MNETISVISCFLFFSELFADGESFDIRARLLQSIHFIVYFSYLPTIINSINVNLRVNNFPEYE